MLFFKPERKHFEKERGFRKVEFFLEELQDFISLKIPNELTQEILFQKDQLSSQGKEYIQELFEEILKSIPEDFSLDQTEQIFLKVSNFLKPHLKTELIIAFENFYKKRIDYLKRLAILEKIKASDSFLLEILNILKEHFPQLRDDYLINFLIKVQQEIFKKAKKLKEQIFLTEPEELSLLDCLLEKSFKDLLVQAIRENPSLETLEKIIDDFQNQEISLEQFNLLQKSINQLNFSDLKKPPSQKGLWQKIREQIQKVSLVLGLSTLLFSGLTSFRTKQPFLPDKSILKETLTLKDEYFNIPKILEKINEPIVDQIKLSPNEIIRLSYEGFLKLEPGSVFYSEDLVRYIDQLTKEVFSSRFSPETIKKYIKTVRFLISPKILFPQAVKFSIVQENNLFSIKPVDYFPVEQIKIKETTQTEVLIVGGELESVVGAISSAKEGKKVILLFSGPLGGLSSDQGGNMRYFDYVSRATCTPTMEEVFKNLEMEGPRKWVIPDGVEEKLVKLLKNYPTIRLIRTRTLNSLMTIKKGEKITEVITEEGIKIIPEQIIDSSPDGILAEKAQVPWSLETLNLSYGVVFDILNITEQDLKKLEKISLKEILKIADFSETELKNYPEIWQFYQELKNASSFAHKAGNARWGYVLLAKGFDLYQRIQEIKNPNDQDLRLANQRRKMDGFNVACRPGSATFNSISYQIGEKSFHQGDHNLKEDPEFNFIRKDLSAFQEYIRKLTKNYNLKTRCPTHLYVRGPQKFFSTENYLSLERAQKTKGDWRFAYPLDVRGLTQRFFGDQLPENFYHQLEVLKIEAHNPFEWKVVSFQTKAGPNLWIVNRGAGISPFFTPTYRIIQNLMLVIEDLVKHLDQKDYWLASEATPPEFPVGVVKQISCRQTFTGLPKAKLNGDRLEIDCPLSSVQVVKLP